MITQETNFVSLFNTNLYGHIKLKFCSGFSEKILVLGLRLFSLIIRPKLILK